MRQLLVALLIGVSANMAMAADRALDIAIRQGDLAAARAAIDAGDAVDIRVPPFLMTPLAVAAIRGDLPMVRLLLDAGADPNTPGNRGMNALSAAARSCRAGPGVIAALIEAGANLEDRSGADLTPLMSAIQEERTDIALQLIAAGADIDTRNQYGDGVLNYAIYTRNPSVVQAAMKHGVDTAQLNLLFTTDYYYYPGFGHARPHAPPDCGQQG
jgi:ankyrin repeat protein